MLQTHAPPIFSGHRFHFDVFCTVHTYDMNNAESGAISAKSENSITGLGGTILDLALQISSNFTILRLRKLVLKDIIRFFRIFRFYYSTTVVYCCLILHVS